MSSVIFELETCDILRLTFTVLLIVIPSVGSLQAQQGRLLDPILQMMSAWLQNNHFISVFDCGGVGVNARGVVVNEQGGKGVKCYKYRRATRAWEWLIFTTHGFYHDKSYLRMLLSPPGLGGSNVHHVWCCFLHLKLGS